MVDLVVVEKILGDIKSNVSELRQATDITWEIYRTDKRSRRFVERTLHILIEACIDVAQHIILFQMNNSESRQVTAIPSQCLLKTASYRRTT